MQMMGIKNVYPYPQETQRSVDLLRKRCIASERNNRLGVYSRDINRIFSRTHLNACVDWDLVFVLA